MKLDCGHEPSEHSDFTTGYGKDANGKTFCYACCAKNDKAQMIRDGRATLYLTAEKETNRFAVTNWPGSLSFPVGSIKTGRHNIARTVTTAYFSGPDGKTWSARQYGDMSDLAHCRRLAS
jgi:hypothetical protein